MPILSPLRQSTILFLQSPKLGPPSPSPAGECVPPPGSGEGEHIILREGGRGSQFGREYSHCGTLVIYVLCGAMFKSTKLLNTMLLCFTIYRTWARPIDVLLIVSEITESRSRQTRIKKRIFIVSSLVFFTFLNLNPPGINTIYLYDELVYVLCLKKTSILLYICV